MVQRWLPEDPTADDLRRAPTHRMICFQQADAAPGPKSSALASWCALYPLAASPYTEPDVLVRLVPDRSTLLDLDVGAQVAASKLPDGRWEVRPLEGDGRMVTSKRTSTLKVGFAEARGLAPLIIPRPNRPVSPYAKAATGSTWVPSPSLGSVDQWRRRRRKAFLVEGVGTVGIAGAAVAAAIVGSTHAILLGAFAAFSGLSMARRRWQDRVVTTADPDVDTPPSSAVSRPSVVTPRGSLRTPVALSWRPSHDLGTLAWVTVADDEHGQLEAPVVGLPDHLFDAFPTVAAIDGHFGSGKPVALTLDDGSQLLTVRPLRTADDDVTDG